MCIQKVVLGGGFFVTFSPLPSARGGSNISVSVGRGHHPDDGPLLAGERVLAVSSLGRGCELPLPAGGQAAAQVPVVGA